MKQLTKQRLVLLALRLVDGKSFERAHLQKALFLLQEYLPPQYLSRDRYQFDHHHFGVFCQEVYPETFACAEFGLIRAEPYTKNFKTVTSTIHGNSRVQDVIDEMPAELHSTLRSVMEWVVEQDFESLVPNMYKAYPEHMERTRFRGRLGTSDPESQYMVQLLSAGYQIKDRIWVNEFVSAHGFLMPLLLEAPEQIGRFFSDAALSLELVVDPESSTNDRYLVLSIHTQFESGEALSRLRGLQEQWWLDQLNKGQGHLVLNLEYK
jgi:hypothetical protein